jgi:VWFA-related protein
MHRPDRPYPLFALGLALAALLLPAGAVPAQEGAQDASQGESQDERPFLDTVDVNVINVDVYVTDRDGNPVTGLDADDFEVYENGRLMTLSNFYAVEDRRVRSDTAPPVPETEEESDIPEQVRQIEAGFRESVPEEQRLSLIVYVDNLNIRPHNRRRVLQDVRSFLRSEVSADDRVMLVTYERSLHVRQPFTSDSERVVEALFEVDELSGLAVHAESERRDVLQRIDDAQGGGEALMWAESYAESVKNDLEFTVDALREMVTSLAGLPGRKAILYVSDGVPMIAGEDIFYAVESKFQSTGALTRLYGFDSSRRFEELAAHANANRVSFYTIDAGGLRVASSADAQVFQVDQAGASAHIDSVRIHNIQAPLRMIAEKTGGKAIVNQNRYGESLKEIAHDFRTYYSLGYTPGHSGDGRYYRIEVKLKDDGRGMRLRHREGYRDKPALAQMNDGVLAALNFPYYSNPMDVELSFATGEGRDDGHVLVPVSVKVPLSAITLVPRGETYEANANLFLAAMDDRGWVSEVQRTPLPISIAQADLERALEESFVYTVPVLMRKGEQKVAVGIRDEIASNNSFVTGTVQVR